MNPIIIYGLRCPIKNEIVYVGSSASVESRLAAHKTSPTDCIAEWIYMLKAQGKVNEITVVVLSKDLDKVGALRKEKWWINHLSKKHDLFNRYGRSVAQLTRSLKAA